MEYKETLNKVVEANKNWFNYSYDMVVTYQNHVEKMVNMSLDQVKWLPEENKKAIKDCGEYYKKLRTEYKATVDNAFTNFAKQ